MGPSPRLCKHHDEHAILNFPIFHVHVRHIFTVLASSIVKKLVCRNGSGVHAWMARMAGFKPLVRGFGFSLETRSPDADACTGLTNHTAHSLCSAFYCFFSASFFFFVYELELRCAWEQAPAKEEKKAPKAPQIPVTVLLWCVFYDMIVIALAPYLSHFSANAAAVTSRWGGSPYGVGLLTLPSFDTQNRNRQSFEMLPLFPTRLPLDDLRYQNTFVRVAE